MATRPSHTDETRHYVPTPFPEARAFPWDDLLEPTQRGLHELLSWLEAACGNSLGTREARDEHLSTSLLISGPRGSGKTTVLLSAVQALRDWREFLERKQGSHLEAGASRAPASGTEAMRRDLCTTLEHIEGRVVWLEPLDLEPVPPGANLLATLLVRVRAALDAPQEDTSPITGHARWSSSILEESAEEAWGKLDHLIRDASFMWEDSASTLDTRARAEQQIKAAEIYATFQHRFTRAMEDVAKTLSLPRFGTAQGQQVILVLPIDNVDRSIEHLHNIVKLTRMVASPRLWFVLAASHQEFQLFMERSFQKELILSGQAGIGAAGQDETLAIARRQSATTLRRALPPSYRINLGPVDPYKAWEFCPQGVESEDARRTLGSLLEQLRLPSPPKRERTQVLASFADLLNLAPRLSDTVMTTYREAMQEGRDASQREVILTHAARLALSLPARTLQDLWHATRRELQGTHASSGEAAVPEEERTVRVAAEMLRNAIDESDLPAWASQQLLNRILRYDDQGRIFLDLTGMPVRRSKRSTLSDVLEWPHPRREGDAEANERVLLSELHLRHFHDVVLMLSDVDREGPSVLLPGNVAGWFMLLHDVLMFFEPPRVLNPDVTPFEMSPELVVTMHELWVDSPAHTEPLVQLECWWSRPSWETFVEFAIFTAQWKAFLKRTADGFFKVDNMRDTPPKLSTHHRFILAAWVENICSVSGRELGRWDWDDTHLHPGMESVVQARERDTVLADYEQRVRETVATLLEDIRAYSVASDRLWSARVWLQDALPLLVRPEFSPAPAPCALLHWPSGEGKRANKNWDELVAYWEDHGPRRTRLREQMVRAAVGRSGASEALRRHLGKDEDRDTRLYYGWLDTVVRTWFQAMKVDRPEPEDSHGDVSHEH